MDPATAIGLTANVFQFIEYGHKLVTKLIEIYSSMDGRSHDMRMLNESLQHFKSSIGSIISPERGLVSEHVGTINDPGIEECTIRLRGHAAILKKNKTDKSLVKNAPPYIAVVQIAENCQAVAYAIATKLERLKCEGDKKRKWNSLKAALKELWSEKDLKDLQAKLDEYRSHLMFQLQVSMRQKLDLLSQRQEDQFETIDAMMREVRIILDTRSNQAKQTSGLASSDRKQSLEPETKLKTIPPTIQDITSALAHGDIHLLKNYLAEPEVTTSIAQQLCNRFLEMDRKILSSLKFPVMEDRGDEISEAERDTLDWIFGEGPNKDASWSNISEWMQSDDPIYWVTGKAGSGKSTLMKHISYHRQTTKLLKQWASDTPLVVARFFFWNVGTQLQKSQEGLLRSLLYQCLKQRRELIPVVLGNSLKELEDYGSTCWKMKNLTEIFCQMINQTVLKLKFVFFIDGLDEYSGDYSEIGKLFKDIFKKENVKLCASSRPLVVFERLFQDFPGLMVQNLTQRDIRNYLRINFMENERLAELEVGEPGLISRLNEEILTRAAGVFLWVKLVARSLLDGLGNYDSASDLFRRLREIPRDLENLYWHMLKSVKPEFYLGQAYKLLQVVRSTEQVSLGEVAHIDLDGSNDPLQAKFGPLNEEDERKLVKITVGRLKSRGLGLLEIPNTNHARVLESTVTLLHRSVAEWLDKSEVQQFLIKTLQGEAFDPNLALFKAHLFLLKQFRTIPQENNLLENFWLEEFFRHVGKAAQFAASAKTDWKGFDLLLLEELERIITFFREPYRLKWQFDRANRIYIKFKHIQEALHNSNRHQKPVESLPACYIPPNDIYAAEEEVPEAGEWTFVEKETKDEGVPAKKEMVFRSLGDLSLNLTRKLKGVYASQMQSKICK